MLRRCIWELSSGRSGVRRQRQIRVQTAPLLSRSFSNASPKKSPQVPAATEEISWSGSNVSKLLVGSVLVGAAAMAAYQTGYLDIRIKNEKPFPDSSKLDGDKSLNRFDHSANHANLPSEEQQSKLNPDMDNVEKYDGHQDAKDSGIKREVSSELAPRVEPVQAPVKETEFSSFHQEILSTKDGETNVPKASSEGIPDMENSAFDAMPSTEASKATNGSLEQNEKADHSTKDSKDPAREEAASFIPTEQLKMPKESGRNEAPPPDDAFLEMSKDSTDNIMEPPRSLAHSYSLQTDERIPEVSRKDETAYTYGTLSKDKEVPLPTSGYSKDKTEPGGGKIVLDLIEAIDAAKRKQAEVDAYIFTEEKRMLKQKFFDPIMRCLEYKKAKHGESKVLANHSRDKYEKELKDARARELMYAEEAAMLDKELDKEKAKAASTIKMLQEKAEQNLREELQRTEEEASIKLQKAQELAKAELAASIAREKSFQIEKIAEANLHINALCMAFYARSEESRQTHSVYKLALGTLALEDALSKGLPIRAEVDALHQSLEGIDRDSLLELALGSLPEETLNYGTSTQMQLNQNFDSLKGSLRHFSLIPAGGGGVLAHTVAHIASLIKLKEDQSGQGVESLISKVDSCLVEGKIAEAADTLEGGVRGSEASEIVVDWVRQARNRAVAEQALALLQSYASSITFA